MVEVNGYTELDMNYYVIYITHTIATKFDKTTLLNKSNFTGLKIHISVSNYHLLFYEHNYDKVVCKNSRSIA